MNVVPLPCRVSVNSAIFKNPILLYTLYIIIFDTLLALTLEIDEIRMIISGAERFFFKC